MEVPCPHCGQPINPAKMLGAIRSAKKAEASKANGKKNVKKEKP